MGWLQKKRALDPSKLHSQIKSAFFNVGSDIKKIYNWINYLSSRQDSLEATQITPHDFSKVRDWIHYLHSHSTELHNLAKTSAEKIIELEEKYERLSRKIENFENPSANLIGKHDVTGSVTGSVTTSDTGDDIEMVESPLEIPLAIALTPSESKVVNILYSANHPLTHSQIADRLNLNYGTIKNLISRIRRKGINVSDRPNESSEKEFYLLDQTKIELSGR